MNKTIIGHKIREARQRAGLTQSELAKKASVSYQTINGIENGRGNTTIRVLFKLEELLGINFFK